MGRPLNKKYFGNRNIGSASTTADNGIGGQSIASVTIATAGAYTVAPTGILFANPLLEGIGGVRATGSIATYKAVSATVSGTQGGTYVVGQLLTVTTAGGTCTFRVASLSGSAVATVDLGTGSSEGTFTSLVAGAQATTVNTGTGTGCTLTISYGIKSVTVTEPGSGYLGANYATATITATTTSTDIVTVSSTAQLFPGASLAVTGTTIGNISAGTYFVHSIVSATTIKLSTSYANYKAGTVMAQTTASGTMTAVASQHLVISITGGTSSIAGALTQVLSTDSGRAGTVLNQENSIVAIAYVPAANGGTKPLRGDIVKQINDRRYKVETADGTGRCQLVATTPTAGQMTIKATDQAGKTYYVTKLTATVAVLVPYGATGHQFPLVNGNAVRAKWTFGNAVAPSGSETGVVTIENA